MSTLEAIAAVLHFQAFDSTSGRWPDLRWPTGGAARSGQQSELCGCRASLIWSRLCLVLVLGTETDRDGQRVRESAREKARASSVAVLAVHWRHCEL